MRQAKSSLHPSNIGFVVECAFKTAHLEGRKISDCQKLSEKIAIRVGRSISATTLYRMLHVERYHIRPYDFTVQALLVFCGVNNFEELLHKFHYEPLPEPKGEYVGGALVALLTQQLELERYAEIRRFLSKLPDNHYGNSFERHDIGKTFGYFFRNLSDAAQRRELISYFLEEDNFFLYFFETFPDLDFAIPYFFTALEEALLIKKFPSILHSIQPVSSPNISVVFAEKAVFACSLYIHLAFSMGNYPALLALGDHIFPSINHFAKLENMISSNHVIVARLYNAYSMYMHAKGAAMKFSFEKQKEHVKTVSKLNLHPWAKIFTHTLIFDNWHLLNSPWKNEKADFEDEIFLQEARQHLELEPFLHRYLAHFGERPSLLDEQPGNFRVGSYEVQTSKKLIHNILKS
jgi:hypothetical protein